MFKSFLVKFTTFFLIENTEEAAFAQQRKLHLRRQDMLFKKYYDMTNPNFRNFIIGLLQNLEPYHLNKGSIIFNELDGVAEIMFVCHGSIGVGYEINKFKKITMQLINRAVIGAYYATFNERSNFIYCSTSPVESHFIRKHAWLQLLEANQMLAQTMKRRTLDHY